MCFYGAGVAQCKKAESTGLHSRRSRNATKGVTNGSCGWEPVDRLKPGPRPGVQMRQVVLCCRNHVRLGVRVVKYR